MERHFSNISTSSADPPLTLLFSRSLLNAQFRSTNPLLVSAFVDEEVSDYTSILTTLLNQQKPDTTTLLNEGSGEGLLTAYLNMTFAEFTALSCSPGDKNVLRGLETNLLRIASDFF